MPVDRLDELLRIRKGKVLFHVPNPQFQVLPGPELIVYEHYVEEVLFKEERSLFASTFLNEKHNFVIVQDTNICLGMPLFVTDEERDFLPSPDDSSNISSNIVQHTKEIRSEVIDGRLLIWRRVVASSKVRRRT